MGWGRGTRLLLSAGQGPLSTPPCHACQPTSVPVPVNSSVPYLSTSVPVPVNSSTCHTCQPPCLYLSTPPRAHTCQVVALKCANVGQRRGVCGA